MSKRQKKLVDEIKKSMVKQYNLSATAEATLDTIINLAVSGPTSPLLDDAKIQEGFQNTGLPKENIELLQKLVTAMNLRKHPPTGDYFNQSSGSSTSYVEPAKLSTSRSKIVALTDDRTSMYLEKIVRALSFSTATTVHWRNEASAAHDAATAGIDDPDRNIHRIFNILTDKLIQASNGTPALGLNGVGDSSNGVSEAPPINPVISKKYKFSAAAFKNPLEGLTPPAQQEAFANALTQYVKAVSQDPAEYCDLNKPYGYA